MPLPANGLEPVTGGPLSVNVTLPVLVTVLVAPKFRFDINTMADDPFGAISISCASAPPLAKL